MKKQLIAAFSFLVLVTACGKTDVELPEKKPGKETVSLWAKTEGRLALPAYAGKGYVLASSDTAIAKAVWKGNGALITTHAPGNTTVTVQDKSTGKPLLQIGVFSRSVETAYGWRNIENEQWKTSVVVKARNATDSRALQNQLLDSIKAGTAGSGFIFRKNEAAEYAQNRQLYKVGYTFDNWLLTLRHEGWLEQIFLNPVQYNVIGLTQDLTDQYKARYPGKKILKVKITRYFTEVLPPG
ncbi:hypothetical protein [Niabella aurantiaca]|uniref:hypothetical protein n=1 Tax=Niabella aurantiaca TaxID=379900 RepID=UPI00036DB146|nr:hypothetical protein [Niabella aurantiaca]